jgi:hypothetical protein
LKMHEECFQAIRTFMESCPDSTLKNEARRILAMTPEELFMTPPAKKAPPPKKALDEKGFRIRTSSRPTLGTRSCGFVSGLFRSGPSEKEAQIRVSKKIAFDEAYKTQRRERFPEAARMYEELLAADPGHLVRFNLARLYDLKPNQPLLAKKHYKILMTKLPQGHPYIMEVSDAIAHERKNTA